MGIVSSSIRADSALSTYLRVLGLVLVLTFIPLVNSKMGRASIVDSVRFNISGPHDKGLESSSNDILHLSYAKLFLELAFFRYTRAIVNTVAYLAYRPTPLAKQPTLFNKDVTVIVTTVDPHRKSFVTAVSNILANRPAKVIVALAGKDIDWKPLANCFGYRNLEVVRLSGAPSKRKQIVAALTKVHNNPAIYPIKSLHFGARDLPRGPSASGSHYQKSAARDYRREGGRMFVTTPLVAFIDDRVYVPTTFLEYLLPPLEDPQAGVVTPAVLTQRFDHGQFSCAGFWNFIGCIYIRRRNFDRKAINTIDGGISTVPGRAFLIRSEIMQDPDFVHSFLNEYMDFPIIGKIGPVTTGEDTFTTRWLYRKGWKIMVQQCPETTVETDNLGTWPRFNNQLSRWSHSSIRSRVTQMGEGWPYIRRYPWTFYSVNIQCLANFPLFMDGALIFTLCQAVDSKLVIILFLCWMLFSKMIKLIPHFQDYPGDIVYFPFYVLFVYYHIFHRLYALATIGNDSWGGRTNLSDFDRVKDAKHANVYYEDGKFYHVEHTGDGEGRAGGSANGMSVN